MLHGWEGSIDSTYMLCSGRSLFNHGYDIFRLNFRDHGRSHHLNQGMFYAVLLEEIKEAVLQIAAQARQMPVYLVGFSLGGNFVLRILRACGASAVARIRHAVAISPALNPKESTRCVDDHPLIRRYFIRKWKRSLQIKAALYPDLYDFTEILKLKTIFAMTEALLERYSDYDSAESYFSDYSVRGDDLAENPLPTTIIVAEDDPIIPVADFYQLNTHANTRLVVHRHGGHNGFLFGWPLKSWYDMEMQRIFDN
jgi:predicted alpha/beta-fold hydrolase